MYSHSVDVRYFSELLRCCHQLVNDAYLFQFSDVTAEAARGKISCINRPFYEIGPDLLIIPTLIYLMSIQF